MQKRGRGVGQNDRDLSENQPVKRFLTKTSL
jgi:hypothetical protein